MSPNRRIFLNIVAVYGRSVYAFVCGLFMGKNGIILVDFMDEFCRSMKPLQTLKNTGMGYSAAYPMGRERIG